MGDETRRDRSLATKITICVGPSVCGLTGKEAVAEQIYGCPYCRALYIHPDGEEEHVGPLLTEPL
jgi:hypothetical protein